VTGVKPVVLKATRNYAGWILVRIRTDQGVEGIGECFSWGSNNLPRVLEIRDMVDSIGLRMGGANPLQIQSHLDHWAREANGLNWASAISGVEIALWDILGQPRIQRKSWSGRSRPGRPVTACSNGARSTAGAVRMRR
jgi:L-alanine-DL-glutamate epimerase-like enolase superfamily enzyme